MASPAPRPSEEKILVRLLYILRRATDCPPEEALEICRRAIRSAGAASDAPLPPEEIVHRAWAECAARGHRRRSGSAMSETDLFLLLLRLESSAS